MKLKGKKKKCNRNRIYLKISLNDLKLITFSFFLYLDKILNYYNFYDFKFLRNFNHYNYKTLK